ncbi:MAG: hypothetical protein ACOYYJ_13165 [Chloroflexota bacterium]
MERVGATRSRLGMVGGAVAHPSVFPGQVIGYHGTTATDGQTVSPLPAGEYRAFWGSTRPGQGDDKTSGSA